MKTNWPSSDRASGTKTITESFLSSLVELPTHDAEEMIRDLGFKTAVVQPNGTGEPASSLDMIRVVVSDDGYTVASVAPCNRDQLVRDV